MSKKKKKKKFDDASSLKWWINQKNGANRKSDDKSKDKKSGKKFSDGGEYGSRQMKALAKMLRVGPTLSEKEIAKAHKALQDVPEINPVILKNREKCNHVVGTMTVDQFKALPNAYAAPLLDKYIQIFGKDNVQICSGCMEILVNESVLTPDKLNEAYLTALAFIDNLLANVRLDEDEIETYKKRHKQIEKMYYAASVTLAKLNEARGVERVANNKFTGAVTNGESTPAGFTGFQQQQQSSGGIIIPDGVALS